MLDENGELKLAKDNITSDFENDSIHALFNVSSDFSKKNITLGEIKHSCTPSSCSLCPVSSYSCSNSKFDVITDNLENKLKTIHPGCSPFCTCCLRNVEYPSITPSYPSSILRNKQSKTQDFFISSNKTSLNNSHLRHSLHSEVDHINDSSNNSLQHYLKKEKEANQILSHKPPLPPRKRTFTNNCSDLEPRSLLLSEKPASSKDFVPVYNNYSMQNRLGNIETNFALPFSKPLSPCLYTTRDDLLQPSNTVERNHFLGIEDKDFVKETHRNLSHARNGIVCFPFKNNDKLSNLSKEDRNTFSNFFDWNKKAAIENNIISLSLTNESDMSEESLSQKCSVPWLGVKSKTASNIYRIFPGPPPIPPPKGLPNVLAPLKSTEVLDKSRFWVRVFVTRKSFA